jgi:hypothetical protein
METQETHNVNIYHCVTCGRVEHVELEAKPPECCGLSMAKAFTETVPPVDFVGEKAGVDSESTLPVLLERKEDAPRSPIGDRG